jgi:hypothetical protein
MKYDKQDQKQKATYNERNTHTIQQQEQVARSQGRTPPPPKKKNNKKTKTKKQDRAQGRAWYK